jgi:hypothetical protein
MPRNFIAEYWRRIRNNGQKYQQHSECKWNEASYQDYAEKIVAALKGIEQQSVHTNNEETTAQKRERRRKWFEIAGLWIAAAVGATAIWFGNRDAGRQRDEMEQQRKVIEADQRAWIKVETVEPYHSSNTISPDGIFFARPKDWPGYVFLHIVLKNVGRGPAMNVRVGVWPILGAGQRPPNLLALEEKNCATLDAWPSQPELADNMEMPIPVVFPGDAPPPIDSVPVVISPENLAKYSIKSGNRRVYQLWFEGCARYTLPGSKQPHESSFAYRVAHLVPAHAPPGVNIKWAQELELIPYENIPASQLLFEERPLTAGPTN